MRRTLLRRTVPALAAAAAAALGCLTASTSSTAATANIRGRGSVDVLGKVVHIADGDTLDIDVWGDGTRTPERIRLTGVNAMELTRYANDPANWRGDCHGVAAAKRLYSLVNGRVVRITAQDGRSMSGSRYRRTIWVRYGSGWRNVSTVLLAEGYGLFLPNETEYATNRTAAYAARHAAALGRGLWRTNSCGNGPSQGADLRVQVRWDAPGDDSRNVNGEFIKVVNHSSYAVNLSGWRVRDSAARGYKQHGYVLPQGTRVPAGGAIYVHPGHGRNTATNFYWGLDYPIFENATGAPKYMGDGGYLFDPQGDMRAWQQY